MTSMRKYLEFLLNSRVIKDYHWTRNGLTVVTSNLPEFLEFLPVKPWHPLDLRYFGGGYVVERFDSFLDGYIDFEITEVFPHPNRKKDGQDENVDSEGHK